MRTIFENRVDRLRSFLTNTDEGVLLTNEVNIGYFSGFFHSEGCLLVTQNSAALLVDFRYFEAAQKKTVGCEVVCFRRLHEDLLPILQKEGISHLSFESGSICVARFEGFKEKLAPVECVASTALDRHIADIRIIKDASEVEKIARAQQIAEEAYLETLNYLKPGVSEREIAARMQFLMKMKGAEDISFDLITITGAKTSLPHGVPSDDIVREGDFFTMDFGAMYEGYHSDTTRTVAVKSATEEMRKIYDIVYRAQRKALTKIAPGENCSDVDKTARDLIEQEGYGEYFGHSTGHGVGLDIHEAPAVSMRSETVLQEGMVITDEPGIYLPGRFGVRIEDMLLVTKNGYRNFVTLPKELIIV